MSTYELDKCNSMAGYDCDRGGGVAGGIKKESKAELGFLGISTRQRSLDRLGPL